MWKERVKKKPRRVATRAKRYVDGRNLSRRRVPLVEEGGMRR